MIITTSFVKDSATVENAVSSLVDPGSVGAQPIGLSGWVLQFSDEFNGSVLDSAKWDTTYPAWDRFIAQSPGGNRTNSNNSNYFNDNNVVLTGDGSLDLFLEPDDTTYPGLKYKSGMIQSLKSYTAYPGCFVESRIRMSRLDDAIWPAAWMSNSATNQWPPEIDYWEHFGLGSDYLTNIYQSGGGSNPSTKTSHDNNEWHVYGVDWNSTNVKFYLDGSLIRTATPTVSGSMYLLFDLAAQDTVSTPITTVPHMYVDYVRVWR